MLELADEADSKSVDGNIVRVQIPLPAGDIEMLRSAEHFLCNSYFLIFPLEVSIIEKAKSRSDNGRFC